MDTHNPLWNFLSSLVRFQTEHSKNPIKLFQSAVEQLRRFSQVCISGLTSNISEFMTPYRTALDSFLQLRENGIKWLLCYAEKDDLWNALCTPASGPATEDLCAIISTWSNPPEAVPCGGGRGSANRKGGYFSIPIGNGR